MRRWNIVLASCLAAALTGCSQVELYSTLPEQEANEIKAILAKRGIPCTKQSGEEGTWKLSVAEDRFAESVELLDEFGYPKDTFAGVGAAFQKSGLVSSPTEERIRFMHALAQDLSSTISRIDGVLVARVHIVLPNNNPFGEKVQPSSAAVFVKHRHNADLESSIPEIKELVVASIEGLEYDKVTIALFAADEPLTGHESASSNPQWAKVLTLKMAPESVGPLWAILAVLLVLGVSGMAVGVASRLRLRKLQAAENA